MILSTYFWNLFLRKEKEKGKRKRQGKKEKEERKEWKARKGRVSKKAEEKARARQPQEHNLSKISNASSAKK